MEHFLNILAGIIVAPMIWVLSLVGIDLRDTPQPAKTEQVNIGATNAIPTSVALFETTLASGITNSATSFTLTSATDKAGTTLASSTYAFIIDEGTASEEMVIADCTATACTNVTRGISPVTGNTAVTALKFAHRRGASVKITDGPQLMILSRIVNGAETVPNKLAYTSGVTISVGDSGQTLVTKTYAENLAVAGAATSTESRGGIVELGTLAEQASSYDGGSDKPTVLQTKNSTSTCQVVGSYNIVASSTTGKLDKGCFDQTLSYSFTATTTFATSTMASTTITNLNVTNISGAAKNADIQTFTSSGTWTKPTGAFKVLAQLWGGGGSGGNSPTAAAAVSQAGGGGGGMYVERWLNASDLGSTVSVTVGTGGAAQGTTGLSGNNGGSTTFGSHETAGGGGGGTANADPAAGGAGGYNFASIASFYAAASNTTGNNGMFSAGGGGCTSPTCYAGGNSYYGGGGGGGGRQNGSVNAGGTSTFGGAGGTGTFNTNATAGTTPSGGGGAVGHDSGTYNSGAGGNGKAIITTFF